MSQSTNLCSNGTSYRDFAFDNEKPQERSVAYSRSPASQSILHRLASKASGASADHTYLLSGSSLLVLQTTFVRETLKVLLSHPRTLVILLVPCKYIDHPTVLGFAKLPKAEGSFLPIVPFDASAADYDNKVADCLAKYWKIKNVDGFMAFEEDKESRVRLGALAKRLNDAYANTPSHHR